MLKTSKELQSSLRMWPWRTCTRSWLVLLPCPLGANMSLFSADWSSVFVKSTVWLLCNLSGWQNTTCVCFSIQVVEMITPSTLYFLFPELLSHLEFVPHDFKPNSAVLFCCCLLRTVLIPLLPLLCSPSKLWWFRRQKPWVVCLCSICSATRVEVLRLGFFHLERNGTCAVIYLVCPLFQVPCRHFTYYFSSLHRCCKRTDMFFLISQLNLTLREGKQLTYSCEASESGFETRLNPGFEPMFFLLLQSNLPHSIPIEPK